MSYKKSIVALVATILACHAHAGFVTGFIVGRASSGSSSGEAPIHNGTLLASDSHHVLTCCRENYDTNSCRVTRRMVKPPSSTTWVTGISPHQYAGEQGYKIIHKIGYLARGGEGCDLIVMEVSK